MFPLKDMVPKKYSPVIVYFNASSVEELEAQRTAVHESMVANGYHLQAFSSHSSVSVEVAYLSTPMKQLADAEFLHSDRNSAGHLFHDKKTLELPLDHGLNGTWPFSEADTNDLDHNSMVVSRSNGEVLVYWKEWRLTHMQARLITISLAEKEFPMVRIVIDAEGKFRIDLDQSFPKGLKLTVTY